MTIPGTVIVGQPFVVGWSPPSPIVLAFTGFTFTQTIAQSVWIVAHKLGRYPIAWSLYDVSNRLCDEYIVEHLDLNTCRVSMDTPTAGLIRLL